MNRFVDTSLDFLELMNAPPDARGAEFNDGGRTYYKVEPVLRPGGLVARLKAMMRHLGGPGSGNFGHVGRPGQVGGSGDGSDGLYKGRVAPVFNNIWTSSFKIKQMWKLHEAGMSDDAISEKLKLWSDQKPETMRAFYGRDGLRLPDPARDKRERQDAERFVADVTKHAEDAAAEMGVPRSAIIIDSGPRASFKVGGQTFEKTAYYDGAGHITLWSRTYEDPPRTPSELRIAVRATSAHESSHYLYDHISEKAASELVTKEMIDSRGEGCGSYAQAYWSSAALAKRDGLDRAINETLAEVAGYLANPGGSWKRSDTPPPKEWIRAVKALRVAYNRRKK